ncbi:MAG: queuosine precursor transporter [Alphaproteobacteria bacterium]|nr:queuosine precursor transporter [Alphaproteobacteria bacterium]
MDRTVPSTSVSLLLLGILYGGLVTIAGVHGAKQVAIGPLAVEAGIFSFLLLVGISSGVTRLHGEKAGQMFVRLGFVPLVVTILLTLFVLQLPSDPGMYPPAKEAFPVILGQSWRLMLAGIVAYGVSVTLNVGVFAWLLARLGNWPGLSGFLAAALSQVVDTLLFITIAFYGVRPVGELYAGQMIAKVVLSAVMVPLVIQLVMWLGQRIDGPAISASNRDGAG